MIYLTWALKMFIACGAGSVEPGVNTSQPLLALWTVTISCNAFKGLGVGMLLGNHNLAWF